MQKELGISSGTIFVLSRLNEPFRPFLNEISSRPKFQ